MKKITILGSTGSIGTNALKVIEGKSNQFEVLAISGYSNLNLLLEQIEKFDPKYICIGDESKANLLKSKYPDKEIYFGDEGLKAMGALDEADIVLTAISGAVGIEATVEAIKKEKRIALANKETMVAAGEYINKLLKKYPKAEIIPVDSEHSALFQSMQGSRKEEVQTLIITASGGTFRGKTLEELKDVTVEQALKHPNWSMGKKITIDSSTLVNKGLEVIEAHMLFGIDYENIEVLVHPQSIIHSMVEFKDSSIIAQIGVPDMKLPIQYSFTYPSRESNIVLERLNLKKLKELTFSQVDNEVFKGVQLAFEAGKTGKTMPCVFNSANEIAVELFLKGKIKFLEIYEIIEEAMKSHQIEEIESLEIIKKVDKETRKWVYENYGRN
ncbi:1-deoxy-D-xylulose-5-phosphate reductoisomerase [Cetobacterium sp. 8H]|uniref:1-deoxy-D-xylulose-5-phosphate reductoisomerase n=1 Tax=Cetobacterium sp. 8H TaxID=2759681 RepID=UPI00163B7412|nr:1-deoxy-D-xylulose-5-phosphate reductoisomerase [Cetobacterium sp. 8H]MBC2851986.1 1-deoxy-D-xylulose-5-phosphate reductoisomerase [Cetobacterium sp. 8H]